MKRYLLPFSLLLANSSAAAGELQPGDVLPELKGEYLTGKPALLPASASGKVALLALGFSYDSRVPVEDWINRFRGEFGTNPEVTFYEIPMIGGMGVMGKYFINRGMRKGTPPADHEHVITVYGGPVAVWKQRVGVSSDNIAYLILMDGRGIVRWRYNGMLDEVGYKALERHVRELLGKK